MGTRDMGRGATGRWGFALLVLAACTSSHPAGERIGGESHFLTSCEASCAGGLDCLGGVCSRACVVGQDSCSDLYVGAACTESRVEPGLTFCDVQCVGDSDCAALSASHRCASGVCRAPSSTTGEDAGVTESDGALPTCSPACGVDEYCLPSGACAPRCSEPCGEPGPLVEADAGSIAGPLATDGTDLFYFTRSLRPYELGVLASEVLYRWDLAGAPVAIVPGQRTLQLAVHDGYLYSLRGAPDFDPSLIRYNMDGTRSRDFSDRYVARFWVGRDALWWSAQNRATLNGNMAVFRLDDTAALDSEPILVAETTETPGPSWGAGNSTAVFSSDTDDGSCRVLQGSLADGLAASLFAPCTGTAQVLFADEDAVFIIDRSADAPLDAGGTVVRIKTGDSSDALALSPEGLEAVHAFAVGNWIYWGAKVDAVTGSLHRSHRDMALPSEELLRGDLDPRVFSVVGESLVWSRGDRLFVKPLRALPCSDSVPCEGGATCSAGGRCE